MSGPRRLARSSLTVRVVALAVACAALGALLCGLLTARLVTLAARDAGRDVLAAQAEVVAAQLSPGADRSVGRLGALLEPLAADGVRFAVVTTAGSSGPAAADVRPRDAADVLGGREVSRTGRAGGERLLVEGRPAAQGVGVVLVQEVDRAAAPVTRRLAGRVVLAVVVGAVVAGAAGAVLAVVAGGPLRRAARAVGQLRAGRRDVRVAEDGPAEVADLAAAVNGLADALERSEARERELLLSVSHDLRTPLTSVTAVAEAIADGVVDDPAQVRAQAGVVLAQARRLDTMIGDLLDLARLGAHELRLDVLPVDLGALVVEAAHHWEAAATAAGARVVTDVPSSPLVVRTDAARVRQALDGLCANAVRQLGDGGSLVLAVRTQPTGAVVEVRDTGPGLDGEEYAHAFERRFLADRRPGGSGAGVGLSLVRALAERLGGRAEAAPAPEGGACMRLVLPAVAPR